MSAKPFLFRNSPYDAIVALCGLLNVAFLLWTFLAFASLPWWAAGLSFFVLAWAYCWNLQCISHNFIHNPFFTNVWLNRAFGVLETLCIGMPHQLYHHYHLNHHAGDNDAKGPDGTTRDWSSIYRYGKGDAAEAFWRYCLLSFFRVEITPVLRVCIRHGRTHVLQTIVETIVLATFWLTMLALNWRYFLFFYLPSFFLGWVLSYAEGYLKHYGAQPGNPFANSVSSYHRLYNFLWFNNGYHQEHHWDPKMHWTRMKELSQQIRPHLEANQTRILRGPHMTAWIEDHFKSSTPARPETTDRAGLEKRAA
ncbi:MAG TPA: fatty acid desaturase [Gemmataceae bacterium]|nr:fatty acid desaturase [Gemmataceae bacterium]